MDTFDAGRARGHGQWVALAVYGAITAALTIGHEHYLRWLLGEGLSASFLVAVGLFATALFNPITNLYARLEAARYCAKRGHLLTDAATADGTACVICRRCGNMTLTERSP